VVVVIDDDRAGERHHAHHHAEAGLRRENRRDHAATRQELAERRRRARVGGGRADGEGLRDLLGIRPDEEHEDEPDERERGPREPEERERVAVELAPGEERAEDRRPQDRPEDRADEDERDPACTALRRVHVAGGGAREQRGASRRAHEDQPEEDGHRRLERAPERREGPAGRAQDEPGREDGHAAEPVHRAPGRQRGERAGSEDDRRPEPEQPLHAGDEHEGQGRDGRGELHHPGVRRERRREERRVALDREPWGRGGHEAKRTERGNGPVTRCGGLP
jgi:hypothetical protein